MALDRRAFLVGTAATLVPCFAGPVAAGSATASDRVDLYRGLRSYGANQREAHVRLAAYADKLLRGARTAELPVEQPAQFELVVNLRTAPALGIALPHATLLLANRRIE